jgi:hypothetical protein
MKKLELTFNQTKKNPEVKIFGFDANNVLEWNEGPAKDVGQVKRGDTEHVLEWHTVARFFDRFLATKIPSICETLKKYFGDKPLELEIDGVPKATFSKLIADEYPSTSKYAEEFIILDYKPNELVKMHVS